MEKKLTHEEWETVSNVMFCPTITNVNPLPQPAQQKEGDIMEYIDLEPRIAPGWTITQSRSDELADKYHARLYSFQHMVDELGGTTVPDPKPTNAEKLEGHLVSLGHITNLVELARKLDERGVKAPGDDND